MRAQCGSPVCPLSIPLILNPHRLCAPWLGSQRTLQKYTPTWELPVFSRDSAWQDSNPSFPKVSLQLGNLLPTKDLQLLLSACLYFLTARFTSVCQHAQLSKDHFNLFSYLNNLNTECSERWWGSREHTIWYFKASVVPESQAPDQGQSATLGQLALAQTLWCWCLRLLHAPFFRFSPLLPRLQATNFFSPFRVYETASCLLSFEPITSFSMWHPEWSSENTSLAIASPWTHHSSV